MRLRSFLLACCAFPLFSQGTPPRNFEIELPRTVASESVFIFYCLSGHFGSHCSWVPSKQDVSSYFISAIHDGEPATDIKAMLYAPGCKLKTVEFAPTVWKEPRYLFPCAPLGDVRLTGVLTHPERLNGQHVKLRAKYMAYWGRTFLGMADGPIPTIPVGEFADLGEDNRFEVSVPDFSQDPLAGDADHRGALQVWATDAESGDLIALLIPADHNSGEKKTNLGGLNIEAKYPADIVFVVCATAEPHAHDHLVFATRSDPPRDACDR